ncbi:MAG: FkbM family methyltransferase [Chlamydiota bacterium]
MKKYLQKCKLACLIITTFFISLPVAFGDYLPDEAYAKLWEVHERIQLIYGDPKAELPEQLLAVNFLPANAKVLELGGDVGRNSCVIASLLEDSSNMVVVEPRLEAVAGLKANRNHNHFKFHIEPSAISEVPLVQKGWNTKPSDVNLPGYSRVRTITFRQLLSKYKIDFDTLVVDCEGALYYILKDDVSILKNIQLILIENDFSCYEHAKFVFDTFEAQGFKVVHNEGDSFWRGHAFYQVWSR